MEKATRRLQAPGMHHMTHAIAEISSSVQENCSGIAAMAQLALAALHAPQEHHSPQALAHALRAIRDSAELLADHVKVEARRLS